MVSFSPSINTCQPTLHTAHWTHLRDFFQGLRTLTPLSPGWWSIIQMCLVSACLQPECWVNTTQSNSCKNAQQPTLSFHEEPNEDYCPTVTRQRRAGKWCRNPSVRGECMPTRQLSLFCNISLTFQKILRKKKHPNYFVKTVARLVVFQGLFL